jgi:hypothetical protein
MRELLRSGERLYLYENLDRRDGGGLQARRYFRMTFTCVVCHIALGSWLDSTGVVCRGAPDMAIIAYSVPLGASCSPNWHLTRQGRDT